MVFRGELLSRNPYCEEREAPTEGRQEPAEKAGFYQFTDQDPEGAFVAFSLTVYLNC